MTLETLVEINSWVDNIKLSTKPWGYFPERDLIKSEATEYDLSLMTEEYEGLDSLGQTVTRIKTKKDYILSDPMDISAEMLLYKTRLDRIQAGEAVRLLTDRVMNTVIGFNCEHNLSTEQLDEMEASFAPILAKLQAFRPDTAKTLIEAIIPDGVLVTEEMRSELLACYPTAKIG